MKFVTETSAVDMLEKQDVKVSLNELVKSAIKSRQGLYPHEILMLEYAPYYKTANNNFQNFWYYEYSVTEPQTILDYLCQRGFIDVGDLKTALERLKVTEIKEELKILNQKVTGKKQELIDRLIENANFDVLNTKYSERYYVLTTKGELELKENAYVSYLHRNRYMTIWEMNQRIAQTKYPYRDILWGYFNQQAGIHFQNFDFGLYRNIRMNMYQFLMEEKKPKTALHMLCEVLSFDLSGLGNNENDMFNWEKTNPKLFLSLYESNLECFFPYQESKIIIPPAIGNWFSEMQTILELDDVQYRDAILRELNKVHPPRRIFLDEECADIIMAHIHDDKLKISEIFKNAEKREKFKIQKLKARIK